MAQISPRDVTALGRGGAREGCVAALLAANTSFLTAHDITASATWTDKFRDANVNGSRDRTRQRPFVDIEVCAPRALDQTCLDHPPIPAGATASGGRACDFVVAKIQEFAAELANPATDHEEQIATLKFLLHFVGDLH